MSEGSESEERYPGYESGDALRTPSIVTNGEGDFSDHDPSYDSENEMTARQAKRLERGYALYEPPTTNLPKPVPNVTSRLKKNLDEWASRVETRKMDVDDAMTWLLGLLTHQWAELEQLDPDSADNNASSKPKRRTRACLERNPVVTNRWSSYARNHAMSTLRNQQAFIEYHVGQLALCNIASELGNDNDKPTELQVMRWASYQRIGKEDLLRTRLHDMAKGTIRDTRSKFPRLNKAYMELVHLERTARRLGKEANGRQFIKFVNATNFNVARQALGKFLRDGSKENPEKSKPLSAQPNIPYHIMHTPTYLQNDLYSQLSDGKPFTSIVLNRAEIAKLEDKAKARALLELPQDTLLTAHQVKTLDIDVLIDAHPQIVECVFIDLAAGAEDQQDKTWRENFGRLMSQVGRASVAARKLWRRGEETGKAELGGIVSTASRVDHHGKLGDNRRYSNWHNQATNGTIRAVEVGEEWAHDHISLVSQEVVPSVIKTISKLNRDAHLPPRGIRGFSITGAASVNFLTAAHEEPLNDPLFTLAECASRSQALRGFLDFVMAFPGLDNGKGLIIIPTSAYIWMWKGAINVHGGIASGRTEDAIMQKDSPYEHIVIGMYQKEKPLNYGHRYLREPTSAKVFTTDLDKQNAPHALNWMM